MFTCHHCNFQTPLRANYKRHLATKKHLRNIELKAKEPYSKCQKNEPKMNHNEPKMNQNEPVKYIQDKPFECIDCKEKFNTKASMRRHQLHRCKANKKLCDTKELLKKEKIKTKKLTKIMMEKGIIKQEEDVSTLTNITQNSHNMTNSNNTINNTTNNITINGWGKEDLSHITGEVLDKLIETPGIMISKLLEMIHFNVEKPENMNLFIPNIRDKFIRLFTGNEWRLESKKTKIPQLLERSYGMIDDHYNKNKEKYTNFNKKFYKLICDGIDDNNKQIWKEQAEILETTLLNGTKKHKEQFESN